MPYGSLCKLSLSLSGDVKNDHDTSGLKTTIGSFAASDLVARGACDEI